MKTSEVDQVIRDAFKSVDRKKIEAQLGKKADLRKSELDVREDVSA